MIFLGLQVSSDSNRSMICKLPREGGHGPLMISSKAVLLLGALEQLTHHHSRRLKEKQGVQVGK